MSFAWIIVATLLRPAITPDQPWASRRLVPGVLPGFIILALWAVSWLAGWLSRRGTGPAARAGVIAVLTAALVLPAAVTTFGISYRDGPSGPRLVADGLAGQRTYAGEVAAVRGMCAAIPGHASVVIISPQTADQMAQVVRGMCGVPTATALGQPAAVVREVIRGIRAAGRRPVILARSRGQLTRYGAAPRRILALRIQADEHTLTSPPTGTLGLAMTVWMALPAP
jgi:hypothetical protein